METLINKVQISIRDSLTEQQLYLITTTLKNELANYQLIEKDKDGSDNYAQKDMLACFIAAKSIEGCSKKTLIYYQNVISFALDTIGKDIINISTDDLRKYLSNYQNIRNSSKVTIDNIRRILSSFFTWLEDEDYILKNPVRRIHKVKVDQLLKETLSDEDIENLREGCSNIRDLAIIDLLISTGMRVGEMVLINRSDIDFHERECIVLGKGNKERKIYFDAKAKIHMQSYLDLRKDDDTALFVSLKSPNNRLSIGGIESRIKQIGKQTIKKRVHPHKFRRTFATKAINKGMPIEQVQNLLGHVKIDTTMHYAMVSQENVKIAHRKYLG